MTVDEIFSQISAHMIEGLMVHVQLSDYYGFLGLKGYQECHKYHFYDEACNSRKISEYYIAHYNKLIIDKPIANPDTIPAGWFQHKRSDVSTQTKQSSIQAGFDKWVEWETKTKKTYEVLYKELITLNEVAAACEVKKLIQDVDYELAQAEQKRLELSSIEYDMSDIIMMQDDIKKKYHNKIKELELC